MKYHSIQCLRAVAALMVVVLHSHIAFAPEQKSKLWWWPGVSDFGWFGVHLFFVISGFIIAHVLSSPHFEVKKYFARRLVRIVPLYWIVMLAELYLYYERNWFAGDVDRLGFYGMTKSFLILPMDEHPFLAPGWSLEHELIFYVLAALLAPMFGLTTLAVVMITLGLAGTLFHMGWDYHFFSTVQILFGVGVLSYVFREQSARFAFPIAALSFGLTYASLYSWINIGGNVVVPMFGLGSGALIVGAVALERRGWQPNQLLVMIGDASFSLYLWHWLVIPFVSRWKDVGGPPEMWRWVIVFLSIGVAIASYFTIERPLIRFSHGTWKGLWMRARTILRP
jgi:exopolysaccharide production protein ExoZ